MGAEGAHAGFSGSEVTAPAPATPSALLAKLPSIHWDHVNRGGILYGKRTTTHHPAGFLYGCGIPAHVIMPEHYHLVVEFQRAERFVLVVARFATAHSKRAGEAAEEYGGCRRNWQIVRICRLPSKLAVWKEQARALGIISDAVLRAKMDATCTTTLLGETWFTIRRCGPGRSGALITNDDEATRYFVLIGRRCL